MHAPAALEVHLTALGVPLAISITGTRADELSAAVHEAWAWCVGADIRPVVKSLKVGLGDVRPDEASSLNVWGDDLDGVMEQLTSLVTVTAIEARSGELLLLHANGIADPASGQAVVMVGPSGAGKTTAALTLAPGRSYLTDETLALDIEGLVVPYPKPLSVRRNGKRLQLAPAGLGALPPPLRPCRVGQVWLLDRRDDHVGDPVLTSVTQIMAMVAVAGETSYLSKLERPLHRLAGLFEGEGSSFQVTYREAADLQDLLTTVLQASTELML